MLCRLLVNDVSAIEDLISMGYGLYSSWSMCYGVCVVLSGMWNVCSVESRVCSNVCSLMYAFLYMCVIEHVQLGYFN